jgi:YVTN family beta-propeller protein
MTIDNTSNTTFISVPFSNVVYVIDNDTFSTLTSFSVFGQNTPQASAIDPINNYLYVTYINSNSVSVFDMSNNYSYVTTINGFSRPRGICYDSVNQRMYVSNTTSSSVSIIDTNTLSLTSSVITNPGPFGIDFDPITARVFVPTTGSTVNVIDTLSNTIVTTLSFSAGSSPVQCRVDVPNNTVYVVMNGGGYVASINTLTLLSGVTFNSGINPLDVVSVNNKVYVPSQGSYVLTIYDTITNTTSTLSTGTDAPQYIVYDTNNDKLYVDNNNGFLLKLCI